MQALRHGPRHWTLWTPKTITRMLGDTGFDVLSIVTPAAAVTWTWSVNHVMQEYRFPKALMDFFSMNNPLALGVFWALDLVPSNLGWSANMRVIAQRR